MSVKTTAQIAAEILTNVSDALTKQNTAAKMRQVLDDLNDTMFSGKVLEVSLSITSAQIFALNSTPLDIVAAPGAGKYIEVVSASGLFTKVSAPYTTNYVLGLYCDGADSAQISDSALLISTISRNIRFQPTSTIVNPALTQIIPNTALQIKLAVADPTAGLGDGTLIVKVLYRIVTI